MIDEIELYLKLINNDRAEMLLKCFKDSATFGNLELKRLKLRKHFRTNTKKFGFANAIRGCRMPEFESYSEEEFFKHMSLLKASELTDDIRFANALLFFPEKTRSLMPKLVENHESGKPLFSGLYNFDTEDEIRKFIKDTINMGNGEMIREMTECLMDMLPEEDVKKVEEIVGKISEFTLGEYFESFSELEKKHGYVLVQLAFCRCNPDEDSEMMFGMLKDTILYCLQKAKLRRNFVTDAEKKQMDQLKKEHDHALTNMDNLKGMNKLLTEENKILEKKIRKLQQELEVRKAENEKLKRDGEASSNRACQLENQWKRIDKNINSMVFENEHKHVVISCHANEVLERLFPQVVFITMDEWNDSKRKLLSKNGSYKRIFIQRNGVSTGQIDKVREFASSRDIPCSLFMADSPCEVVKKMIEVSCDGRNSYEAIDDCGA